MERWIKQYMSLKKVGTHILNIVTLKRWKQYADSFESNRELIPWIYIRKLIYKSGTQSVRSERKQRSAKIWRFGLEQLISDFWGLSQPHKLGLTYSLLGLSASLLAGWTTLVTRGYSLVREQSANLWTPEPWGPWWHSPAGILPPLLAAVQYQHWVQCRS